MIQQPAKLLMMQAAVIVLHAVTGWALCGATIAVARRFTTLRTALILHAVAAPVIFALVSWVYFRWFGGTDPAATAATFIAIVIFLDVGVVAAMIERSFTMFRSVLGTWLPFALIILSVWLVGLAMTSPP